MAISRAIEHASFRVIPVLLPGGPQINALPLALRAFHVHDCRAGITPERSSKLAKDLAATPKPEPLRTQVRGGSTSRDVVGGDVGFVARHLRVGVVGDEHMVGAHRRRGIGDA